MYSKKIMLRNICDLMCQDAVPMDDMIADQIATVRQSLPGEQRILLNRLLDDINSADSEAKYKAFEKVELMVPVTIVMLSIYLSEYQLGQRVSHKKVLELSYEDVKSSTNGLIVITPDFDNFTAKLIAADKYSKYMTEIPILEGVTNREYYGRSATSIENKCKIEYGTEQGLAALIYGEKGLSSLPIQDITGEHITVVNLSPEALIYQGFLALFLYKKMKYFIKIT